MFVHPLTKTKYFDTDSYGHLTTEIDLDGYGLLSSSSRLPLGGVGGGGGGVVAVPPAVGGGATTPLSAAHLAGLSKPPDTPAKPPSGTGAGGDPPDSDDDSVATATTHADLGAGNDEMHLLNDIKSARPKDLVYHLSYREAGEKKTGTIKSMDGLRLKLYNINQNAHPSIGKSPSTWSSTGVPNLIKQAQIFRGQPTVILKDKTGDDIRIRLEKKPPTPQKKARR